MNRRIFVVIAAYNESRAIAPVVARVRAKYPHVVVVDDGSTDATTECLQSSGAHLLRHRINRGQGAALQTGIRFALMQGADVIVTFDADGQHDEADIDVMAAPILRGECDVTLGSRFLGSVGNMPFTRRIVLKLAVAFTRVISNIRVTDAHNGFRAFSRDAAAGLRITMDRMAHASEILDEIRRNNWRFQEIPVRISYSAYSLAKGQSSWNALRIGSEMLFRKITM
ncbi:MAG: glycosyltransferase family 2 protein [Bryobacteraceae bacterium]|nr:glycosyltransferase family 2 protein [Bryobacteraceae bacterium]